VSRYEPALARTRVGAPAWGALALGLGPGLCKILHPNFGEFLFHALG
jgi:hypothetical protein